MSNPAHPHGPTCTGCIMLAITAERDEAIRERDEALGRMRAVAMLCDAAEKRATVPRALHSGPKPTKHVDTLSLRFALGDSVDDPTVAS